MKKINLRNLTLGIFALTGVINLVGCSDSASITTSQFKVQLDTGTGHASLANPNIFPASPSTSLKAKLGGVDLLADCTGGNPPGNCLDLGKAPDPDIWVNAGCNDDIAQCTTSNTEFFELINPSAANTVLNSQGRSIDPGTFTHVRIYLLNNDAGNALECNNSSAAARPATPIQVTLASPITVTAGQSVTVTLSYDPSAVDCDDDTTIVNAFSGMTATATIN